MYTSGWPNNQNRCCHRIGSPPGRRIEEVRPPPAVEQQLEQAHRDDRQREHQQELHDQPHPHEHRHAEQGHARCPHVDDRDRQVDGTCRRSDAGDQEAERVEGHADRWIGGGVRGIPEPPAVRRSAQERTRVQEQPAQQEHPEAVGVQPRERDVARPDHQGQQVVEEGRRHRHHEQEDHRDPVHREDLVVLIGVEERAVGLGQLGADQQGFEPAHDEEHERGHPVHDPDLLVVDRGEPAPEAGQRRRPSQPSARGPGNAHACHGRAFAPITSGCTGRPPARRSRPR